MARPAKPWPWHERNGYYAWIGGKRERLCDLDDGIRQAHRELARKLTEAEARRAERAAPVPVVGRLVVLYLKDLMARRDRGEIEPETKRDAERRIEGFAELHGELPADQVRDHHLTAWLATKPGWGPTRRHDGFGAVKTMFRWAKRAGHIEQNPLADAARPQKKKRREEVPTAAQAEATIAAAANAEQRDILVFIRATMCRPKEARTLEARHLRLDQDVAVLDKHKTARKTGKDRKLFLNAEAKAIAARLAAAHPQGPIFRNSEGRPWTVDALSRAVRHARKRVGLGKETVAYGLRHQGATQLLEEGVALPVISKILGHESVTTTEIYLHLDQKDDAMLAAVNRRGRTGDQAPGDAGAAAS